MSDQCCERTINVEFPEFAAWGSPDAPAACFCSMGPFVLNVSVARRMVVNGPSIQRTAMRAIFSVSP